MNFFTKAAAFILFGALSNHIYALTDKEVIGYSVASGVVVGSVAGLALASSPHNSNKIAKSLVAACLAGGVSGFIAYWILSQYTPQARLKAAQGIVRNISRAKLAQGLFITEDELFDFAEKLFNIRWPIALAHEDCITMLDRLEGADLLLHLAAKDTVERGLLSEIANLAAEIEPLSKILKKHARILQTHTQYDIQVILLEGFRREQRMEEEAKQRHREAMQKQDDLMRQQRMLHEEAMRQQRMLNGRA